jgi:CHRD domain
MHGRKTVAGIILGAVAVALIAAAPAGAAKTTLTATLSGANEVPGPGDPDGSGQATVEIKVKKGKKKAKICSDITFAGIGSPFAGHIHEGGPTTDGPIVFSLFENVGTTSPVDACGKAKRGLAKRIAKNPGDFYVNLHNDDFPGGAIRGQLQK